MTAHPTAARCLARALARRGVRHAFGMPGGVLLPVLDALREEGIAFVLSRHETAAAFMAEATWRLTGTPGVALGTLGPGSTQLLSGVAGAWLDRAPLVAITGDVPARNRTLYTHQVLDQRALFAPVVHHAVTCFAQFDDQGVGKAIHQSAVTRKAHHEEPPGSVTAGNEFTN